jgi:hypothetical protein
MPEESGVRELFTDEEAAFLRYAQFGELPPRVMPSDRVELIEAEPRQDVPERALDPHIWPT